MVCTVPAFLNKEINEPVTVQLFAMSSGKRSDPHNFVYTPKGQMGILEASTTHGCGNHNSQTASLNTSNLQQGIIRLLRFIRIKFVGNTAIIGQYSY